MAPPAATGAQIRAVFAILSVSALEPHYYPNSNPHGGSVPSPLGSGPSVISSHGHGPLYAGHHHHHSHQNFHHQHSHLHQHPYHDSTSLGTPGTGTGSNSTTHQFPSGPGGHSHSSRVDTQAMWGMYPLAWLSAWGLDIEGNHPVVVGGHGPGAGAPRVGLGGDRGGPDRGADRDKDKDIKDKDKGNTTRRMSLPAGLSLQRVATSVARALVQQRLRSHLGGATATLAALETIAKTIASHLQRMRTMNLPGGDTRGSATPTSKSTTKPTSSTYHGTGAASEGRPSTTRPGAATSTKTTGVVGNGALDLPVPLTMGGIGLVERGLLLLELIFQLESAMTLA